MQTHQKWALVGGFVFSIAISPAVGADEPAEILELKQQIHELDQKIRILERKRELEAETAEEKAKSTPTVNFGGTGLSIRSADSNFVFKLRGYLQADSRVYFGDSSGTPDNTFLIRRARPIFEVTAHEKYDLRIMLDFASGISSSVANNGFLQDGYINARFLPEFQVQFGKFKEPVGLERLQSGANLLFIERGYPTQLVPNRDVGLQLQGDLRGGLLRYEAGIFNGVSDGSSGDAEVSDGEKDFAGRLLLSPFRDSYSDTLRGLAFGMAGTFGNQEGAAFVSRYRTSSQQPFFSYLAGTGTDASPNVVADGTHWRLAPQLYWYRGPLGIFGEYVLSDQELRRDASVTTFGRVRNTAWQVAASYILTGEDNAWRGFLPRQNFNPGQGTFGAWELAARVGQLDVDDNAFPLFSSAAASASAATSWGVGLNWFLNRNVKLSLNYEQTNFDGGQRPFLVDGEKVFLARAQFSF